MTTGHDAGSPPSDPPPPPPAQTVRLGNGPPAPTPESVLRAIAAHTGPWFPSIYAAEADVSRDSLDEPLSVLRLAGLVRIDAWVRNVGQGYVLTPHGEKALPDPVAFLKPSDDAPPPPAPAQAEPEQAVREQPSVIDLRPPVVTPVVVALCLLWFFVGLVVAMRLGVGPAYLNGGNASVPALERVGAVSGWALMDGGWWRLASSCFVHIGWMHLLGNMLALGMMGPLAEMLWGRWRLLVIYAVSGLGGSCLAMANRPEAMLAGASGAIWGVQMSLVAWLLLYHKHLPSNIVSDWSRRLLVVFIVNGGVSLLPNVSWEGHLGGGLAGFVAAGLLNARRFGDRKRRVSALVLLALLPVLAVAGLVQAKKNSDVWKPLRVRAAAIRAVERAAAFNRDVAPLLDDLAPSVVQPVQMEANMLLLRPPARRPAADAAAVRGRVSVMLDKATFAQSQLDALPGGGDDFDAFRTKSRAFAEARAAEFRTLLRLLDANAIPAEAEWAEWRAARRTADRLWVALH